MSYDKLKDISLLDKYQALLIENDRLKSENKRLREQLNTNNLSIINDRKENSISSQVSTKETTPSSNLVNIQFPTIIHSHLNQNSSPSEKLNLFVLLFKAREDVYAKKWQNKDGRSGYSPVCLNEWKIGVCRKPKIKCSECHNKSFKVLNEKVIEEHLKGSIVVGIYPMRIDDTCCFLAIDFDEDGWEKDITALREICKKLDLSIAIERSSSGNGAHVWFFFEHPLPAALARKFGTFLITYSMNKRHEVKFKSYDRLFPNQDTMPKGGFGNLIALPLQKQSRRDGNSVFIDEYFNPYPDQWEFLSTIKKLSGSDLEILISKLSLNGNENEFGNIREDDEENPKPWGKKSSANLTRSDFPQQINIVKANLLYIPKDGISHRALSTLKRLAAFKNPEFYKAQVMRLPIYNKPRIISCSDENEEYLYLPRGCETNVKDLLNKFVLDIKISDKTNSGKKINVEFNGQLKNEQKLVIKELLKYDSGVLAAATAFGKTVIAANLIAERKISTLVIVHRQQLMLQWINKLSEFLKINEDISTTIKKRKRTKVKSLIGQFGGGKQFITGIIDVAIMQSLNKKNEIKEFIKDYGMVIIDECHHIPTFSFEQILKNVHAKYIYGLTATPVRLDGHHPIIFMYCGPVRHKVDINEQTAHMPFEHYVIPRFTGFKIAQDKYPGFDSKSKQISIQELYSELTINESRNQLIVNDVIKNFENGRNSLILTERTAHVELLYQKLIKKIPDLVVLTGKITAKEKREIQTKISKIPKDRPLTLIATGKYIGEGFDEPRLDTLFLTIPIAWKGTLLQYVGRLHRLSEFKKEVQVYDYVDINLRVFEKMYNKRLNGYASFGYKTKGDLVPDKSESFIFNKNSFLPVYNQDILAAQNEIIIVSPFITKRRVEHMLQNLRSAVANNVKVIIVTRPIEDYKEKYFLLLSHTIDILKNECNNLIFKSQIHQKFAIMDQRIVWYGSINLLSFGNAEESMMRIESSNIAIELLRSIDL